MTSSQKREECIKQADFVASKLAIAVCSKDLKEVASLEALHKALLLKAIEWGNI